MVAELTETKGNNVNMVVQSNIKEPAEPSPELHGQISIFTEVGKYKISFLDLPGEIRNKIYENCVDWNYLAGPIKHIEHVYKREHRNRGGRVDGWEVRKQKKLGKRRPPIILLLNHQIKQEANGVMRRVPLDFLITFSCRGFEGIEVAHDLGDLIWLESEEAQLAIASRGGVSFIIKASLDHFQNQMIHLQSAYEDWVYLSSQTALGHRPEFAHDHNMHNLGAKIALRDRDPLKDIRSVFVVLDASVFHERATEILHEAARKGFANRILW
ncbi:hypothetical protein EJ08DRAFT_701615 [Tothia fuscella]|uniref:Uncharacterized protein n=1 Tax=Tothia fuscella TaxID=1048955 RepID=A0A9P4NI46_9PEZI|nr:hypothetical protein EJ08DRAFT_701615 [Tothia fuscella]